MKFLIISDEYPSPDKASGDLRLFTLLSLLARTHEIVFFAAKNDGSSQPKSKASDRLEELGVCIGENSLFHVLQNYKPDVAWFEFYHQARPDFLGLIRRLCPKAKVVVDSVDVHYARLAARAKLTGKPEDQLKAEAVRAKELKAYSQADMVIAISESDRDMLLRELNGIPVTVIPNLHKIPPFPDPAKRRHGELLFVGGFRHDPNIDAMLYFCHEIFPSIVARHPETCLKIIGSNTPESIQKLASSRIDVLGYVSDITPYLEKSYISIAPLRYGGGLKGKVGEAMSFGLPVVTTSFGAQGFGVRHGEELLIGDTAEEFSSLVCLLLDNPDLHSRISRNGYEFVKRNYSIEAVSYRLEKMISDLQKLPARRISTTQRIMTQLDNFYQRHLAWRFSKR